MNVREIGVHSVNWMDGLMRGHAMCVEKVRNAFKVVVGEPL
jgi:hypothetical protein